MQVFLDFETYSHFSIKYGISRYARHSTTDIICLAYNIGPNVGFYVPDFISGDLACPKPIVEAIRSGLEFRAFNSMFEGLIWENICVKRWGWPAIPSGLWHCDMAKSAYSNLPRGLDKAGKILGLTDEKKLSEGKKLIKLCCMPDDNGQRCNDPAILGRLYEYCRQDVVAEQAVDRDTLPFPEWERRIWQLDQKINKAGVPIDLALCNGALKIVKKAQRQANVRIAELSEGRIFSTDKVPDIKAFLVRRGELETTLDKNGKVKPGKLDARAIETKLANPNLDPTCRAILELRHQFASASVKKMQAAINWTDTDGRCRCSLKYFEAGPGRWASTGAQFHNMVRAKNPPQDVLDLITAGDYDKLAAKVGPSVLKTISQSCRAIVKAPEGSSLILSDFSGIEARVCAWFAGEEKLLKQFREKQDVYVTMACDIFGVPDINGPDGKPIKEKRQMGKVPFLGAQYQMGWSKLIFTAMNQADLNLSEADARNIIDVFRSKYSKIPDLWRALEDGAKACVHSGREICVSDKISFRMITHNYRRWLALRLPSGRDINYFEPVLTKSDGKWSLSYTSPKGIKQLYGGLLTENLVQGTSRDLMADAMLRVNTLGLKIILTVHDELICECPLDFLEKQRRIVHEQMETVPHWAAGLPLNAETNVSQRFTKF